MMEEKNYTLSILVENTSGVLSQVSRLFSRKGYNIESITSGTTENPAMTRITIVMRATQTVVDQMTAQLRKLLCVISVKVLAPEQSVQRELILVKVKAPTKDVRDEIIQMVNVFRANIVDFTRENITVVILGDQSKSAALLNLLEDFGILEVVRTGTIAIQRGQDTIYDNDKEKGEFNYGKHVL